MPTDWIPRLISAQDWDVISRGVAQRLKAINHFLFDLYCGQQSIVPPDVMFSCQYYNPELQDFRPPQDVFVHIYGIDLVHMGDGKYVILEDNLRIPSGIAYQMKSTEIGLEVMPELSAGYDIIPYDIRDAYRNMFGTQRRDRWSAPIRPVLPVSAAWTVRLETRHWVRTPSCIAGWSGNCLPRLQPVGRPPS